MYKLLLEKRKTKRLTLDIALILIALFWISRGKYLISFLLIIVAVVGFYLHRNKRALISEEGIRYPYFIDKWIDWYEVDNILLKDGILTIDLKNNSLLQSAISTVDGPVNENEFNEYCRLQMKAASEQRLLKENI